VKKSYIKRILVTGGAGFLGTHLCERFLSFGHDVICVDNFYTGSRGNIQHLLNNPHFEMMRHDVTFPLYVEADEIYNFACPASPVHYQYDPVQTTKTSVHGAINILGLAKRLNCKILQASTSEIYGKSESVPFSEDDDIVFGSTQLPRWSYACSKAIDEFLGLAFYKQYGLNVVIARFFNTIGPRQTGQYGMVVPRFVESALKNESVLIYGTGQQSRCFCYVDDVIDAIITLINCDDAAGEVYNVGSTEEVTIEELADKIIELTKSKSEKKFIAYKEAYGMPMDDMMRRVPSTNRIKQAVGWEPKTNLTKSLKLIIDSYD